MSLGNQKTAKMGQTSVVVAENDLIARILRNEDTIEKLFKLYP